MTLDSQVLPFPKVGEGYKRVSLDDAFAFAERQVRRLITEYRHQFPTFTEQGRWVAAADPWAPTWSGGFLTGQIWAMARRTGDGWWSAQARDYSRLLEPRSRDEGTHDIGFLFDPSWGRWFDLDPSPEAREVLITAGRTMAKRFQPAGGYLSTWVDPGSTFIDVMMNIEVIFRAARLSGDEKLHDIALTHALTSRRHLLRGDGSTIHEGWFDTDTGEFLRAATHQGWRADSSWARGLCWAIYGFTVAYRSTGHGELLDAARSAADYYIAHTPDGVPPNDWLDPTNAITRESSAAAIAAAGILHLSEALKDPVLATHYRHYGIRVLNRLLSDEFLAIDDASREGILQHAVYHQRNGLGIDESVMWGDYYFIEALEIAGRLGLS